MNQQSGRQCVAITGAGSGFGLALARRYAALGWRVAVTDVDAGRANAALGSLHEQGGEGFACRLDVCSDTDWGALAERIESEWGGLEVLVNNAGVAVGGSVAETPMADWQWVLDIDLMGVARGCHQFADLMKRQGYGHIVNVSSLAGIAGAPDIAAYGVAKAGVIALSEALRAEMAPFGVGVSVVCPAFVTTGLTETMRVTDEADRQRVQRWMASSGVSVDDVAQAMVDAVEQKQFMVFTHPKTRWLWRFKRWWPERYHRMMLKSLQRQRERRSAG